ncbi:MAG: glycosyltransferase family 39 protein, partial [Candidatus Daviesbacteria bacterium]|nr:glycosyltransferase family 39 protein [Candidatus Daviesbacteria bacterium]
MKKFWIILILGILIRIFLSFATFHPDIQAISVAGKVVSEGNILNLYDFSSAENVFNYPPLIYWFFGLTSLFFGSNLWLLKLPYLIFDLLVALLLYRLVDPKKALLAFGLWIFNPVNLYATYMMGQFDILPTFFSVLSIYLAFKGKLNLAAVALGVGIAFKLYPVFLVIPLILLGKGLWTKIKLLILTALPYLVSILPYLSSKSFRSVALFANQSSKSLYAGIPVSGGESILLFPAFLLLFYLLILGLKIKIDLWRLFLIPLALFFIFTHFHPQWLIWITPFLVLVLARDQFKNIIPVLIILASWIGSLFFFDSSLTLGMFAPIFPALKNTADIWTILGINIDFNSS